MISRAPIIGYQKEPFFGKGESSWFENTLTKLWRNFVFNPEITDNLKKLMSTGWIDDQWLKSYLKKVKRLFGNKKWYKWSKFSKRFSTRNRKFIKKKPKRNFFLITSPRLTHLEVAKNSYHSQGVSYMGSPIPFVIVWGRKALTESNRWR